MFSTARVELPKEAARQIGTLQFRNTPIEGRRSCVIELGGRNGKWHYTKRCPEAYPGRQWSY